MSKDDTLKFGKYSVEISNRGKIFFPDAGLTKGDIIQYYQKIAGTMLPYLRQRPLTLHRFPDGISGEDFYQKEAASYFPEWIPRIKVGNKDGSTTHYAICGNQATLVYLANQACITPHVWLSRIDAPDKPDRLVFDLDPSDNDFKAVKFGAAEMRRLFIEELKLPVFLMTTGSRGLHVVIPLRAEARFEKVRSLAEKITGILEKRFPDRLTTEVRKDKRKGRLFLDIARNAYGQTAVVPYAMRPKPGAPVATPLEWDELQAPDLNAQTYTINNILRRLGQKPDPWKQINRKKISTQTIEKVIETL